MFTPKAAGPKYSSQRIVVNLRALAGPDHVTLANLPDDVDSSYFETRWGRPFFVGPTLTRPPDEFLAQKIANHPLYNKSQDELHVAMILSPSLAPDGTILSGPQFYEVNTLVELRDVFRKAWDGDMDALEKIKLLAKDATSWDISNKGKLEISSDGFYTPACILFLHEYAKKRLARCANPDCRSYFVRSRNTQQFCGNPVCKDESHKQSMKTYWEAKGKKRRKR